jgi:hypothetical protein
VFGAKVGGLLVDGTKVGITVAAVGLGVAFGANVGETPGEFCR